MKYFEKIAVPVDYNSKEYKQLVSEVKKSIDKKNKKNKSVVKGMVAGAVAGTVASVLTHPLDTLMVSKQNNPEQYLELKKELKAIPTMLGKGKRLYEGIGLKSAKNAIAIGTILGINQLIDK